MCYIMVLQLWTKRVTCTFLELWHIVIERFICQDLYIYIHVCMYIQQYFLLSTHTGTSSNRQVGIYINSCPLFRGVLYWEVQSKIHVLICRVFKLLIMIKKDYMQQHNSNSYVFQWFLPKNGSYASPLMVSPRMVAMQVLRAMGEGGGHLLLSGQDRCIQGIWCKPEHCQ